ncbi:MAG TPA: hypothetical protein VG122_13075 [Gemmata sp.]|jgi:hypothetical protein|nr:hypothetical protein [Gemmata sp.]
MFRRFVFLTLTLIPSTAQAEPPVAPAANPVLRFKWQQNQTLTYKVLHRTIVRETALDDKTGKPVTTEASTNLTLMKKWVVKEIDSAGIATLEMTITEMKSENRLPDGSVSVLDSATPDGAKSMAAYLNLPILTIRVDQQGRIVEVKEVKAGSSNRLQAELPFRMILPDTGPTTGQTWDRTFTLKLDPPLGTGESYEFAQKYTCSGAKDGLTAATVETSLKDPPKTISERVPLVPMLWTGEVYFNTAAGKYHAARLKAKAELPNYQGEGTKFEYESSYAEDIVEK